MDDDVSDPVNLDRWKEVKDRVRSVADDHGRDPDSLQIIAVTKGFDASLIKNVRDGSFGRVGENRVQEALDKKATLADDCVSDLEWHFVGHLQSNKVRKIIGEFDLIHSVDRTSLIDELDKRLSRNELEQDVLMQVNVSGEESKYGVGPDKAHEIAGEVLETVGLNLRGLMTIAPWTDDESVLKETFSSCRRLRNDLEDQFDTTLPELSMGMTNDYHIAIEEGATMLRLGRALFGERPD